MPQLSWDTIRLLKEEKKIRRREEKKLGMRRVRAKMTQDEIEERRAKERERYQKNKTIFLANIKNIKTRQESKIQ